MLLLIDEMLGEHDSMFKFQQRHGLEEAEPDPGLFPEDSGFETAALLAPEALNAELLSSFNSSAYLERMMVSKSDNLVSLILPLTPRTARRPRSSHVGKGAKFLRGSRADRQFPRKAP